MEITANPTGRLIVWEMPNGDKFGAPVKVIEDHFVALRADVEGANEADARQEFADKFDEENDDLIEYAVENVDFGVVKEHVIKLKDGGEWDHEALASAWVDDHSVFVWMSVETFGQPIGAMEGDLPPATEEAA